MKIILFFVLLLFALFGFCEFLHILKLYIIFPKRKLYSHLVVNLQNDTAQKQLMYVCEQFLWYGKSYADFIVPFCDNLDDETFNKCKLIAQKYGIDFPTRI